MANLEAKMLVGAPFLLDTYYRYIDDIFMVFCDKSEQEVQQWEDYCNQFHPSIKELSFLDTAVLKEVCTPTSTPNLQTHTIIYWPR